MRAFVFPGQGSQAVGMGREISQAFRAARETFAAVDEALGQNLSRLMFEGPENELVLTENTQPALMAVSLAVMRVLEREGGFDLSRHVAFVAGHSLGEYSALAASHSLAIEDTARLLKRRGQAMQRAVPVGEGAMAALLGVELEAARDIAREAAQDGICACANDNGGSQIVVSGDKKAVERAIAIASARGVKRAILLPVSAPFHCPLMAPAAVEMAQALETVRLSAPEVPLAANVTASATRDPATIRRLLVEQVTGLVRWRESMLYLKSEGVQSLVEIGSGRVLSGLAKRIDRSLEASAIGTPGEIETFLKSL